MTEQLSAKRVACIADIHGNHHALRAVLDELAALEVTEIWLLGDYAAGPAPTETMRLIRVIAGRCLAVRGNADREAVEERDNRRPPLPADADGEARVWRERDRWSAAQLDRDDVAWLAALPLSVEADMPDGRLGLLAHATAQSDEQPLTPASPPDAFASAFGDSRARVLLCGHVHMQYVKAVGERAVVNVGSVGQPFQGDPAAFWTLLTEAGPSFRRTEYDLEAARIDYCRSGMPGAVDYLESVLLAPPARDEAIRVFEAVRAGTA